MRISDWSSDVCSSDLDLAILEQDHRRDAAHAIFGGSVRMVVDVELGDHHLAVQFVRNFLERRADHLARTAPFGPEIDEDRRVAVEHIGLETVVADRFGTHNLTPEFPLGFQARQSAAPAQAPWRANSPWRPARRACADRGTHRDRKSVVWGKSVSVRLYLGGRR